jgi:hypothetical protein
VNAIQKLLSSLKNVLQSLAKHFKGFGSRFTELHAKLDGDMLLDLVSVTDKRKTKWKSTHVKTVRVHSAVSRGRLMQQ